MTGIDSSSNRNATVLNRPTSSLVKRLAFASPEISITILFATVNSWYFYFLVNIVAIPPVLAGIAFAFGRVIDAVLDPLIGRWIDTNTGGYGRKLTIMLALPSAAATFILIWMAPLAVEGAVLKTAMAATTFAIFTLSYTFVSVPRLAMLPRYEEDHHGRTDQIGTDTAFLFLSLLFAIAGVPALISVVDGAPALSATQAHSWWFTASGLAVIACVAYLPFLAIVPEQKAGKAKEPFRGLLDDVKRVAHVPGFVLTVVAFFLSVVSMASIQSILPFYLESFIGVPKDRQALVLGAVFLVSVLTLPFWVAMGRMLGKLRSLMCGIVLFLFFLLVVSGLERGSGVTLLLVAAACLAGAAISALSVYPWSLIPDAADRYRIATGKANEGLSVSIFTFSNKLAGGCAILLNGGLLSWSGHMAGQPEQSQSTVSTIYFAMVLVPCLFAVLCFAATWALRRSDQKA